MTPLSASANLDRRLECDGGDRPGDEGRGGKPRARVHVDQQLRARVGLDSHRAEVVASFEAADLSAALATETTASGRAEAVVSCRNRVRSAAEAYVEKAPAGMRVDASVAADLFIAARAG